jgi:ribosome-binding factor A
MRHLAASTERFRFLCAEVSEEDGPASRPAAHRGARRRSGRRNGPHDHPIDRKAWQLCRQVAHTLDAVLAECGDSLLQRLRVASVEPLPDGSRLMVTVEFIDDRSETPGEAQCAVNHLHRASGHLRSEVAMAITRRHAPLLIYRLAESVDANRLGEQPLV